MSGLTNSEIMKVVNRYIGVSGGYLGDFTYRTHAEFYEEYCDLDINPYQYEDTTRDRFIAILKSASPEDQAKMLRGVLEKFPIVPESVKTATTSRLFRLLRQDHPALQKLGQGRVILKRYFHASAL